MYEIDRQDTSKRFVVSLGIVLILHAQLLWLAGHMPSPRLREMRVVSSVEFMDMAARAVAPAAVPARRNQALQGTARVLAHPRRSSAAGKRTAVSHARSARPSAGAVPAPAADSSPSDRTGLSARRSARSSAIIETGAPAPRPSAGAAPISAARQGAPPPLSERAERIEDVGSRRIAPPAAALMDEQVQSRLSSTRQNTGGSAQGDGFSALREMPVRSSARRTTAAYAPAESPVLTDQQGMGGPAGEHAGPGTHEAMVDGGTVAGGSWGAQPRRRSGGAVSIASIDIASKAGVVPKKAAAPSSFSEAAREPMEITGPLQTRRIVAAPMPVYPAWAREKSIEGLVTLKFFVGPSGVVLPKVFVLQTSGYAGLDQVCIDSVRSWMFAPLSSSEPQSEQWGNIMIRFELE